MPNKDDDGITSKYIHDIRTPLLYIEKCGESLKDLITELYPAYKAAVEKGTLTERVVGDARGPVGIADKLLSQARLVSDLTDRYWEDLLAAREKQSKGAGACSNALVCLIDDANFVLLSSKLYAIPIDYEYTPDRDSTLNMLADYTYRHIFVSLNGMLGSIDTLLPVFLKARAQGSAVVGVWDVDSLCTENAKLIPLIDHVVLPPFDTVQLREILEA